jgi:hypothetical protein
MSQFTTANEACSHDPVSINYDSSWSLQAFFIGPPTWLISSEG